MAMSNYRDAYAVFHLLDNNARPYFKDAVTFCFDDVYNKDDHLIGAMFNYVDDCTEIVETISKLREDELIPVSVNRPAFVNSGLMDKLGLDSGVVVAAKDDLVAVYLGVVELTDDIETAYVEDFSYNDNCDLLQETEYYRLTEKGLKYLAELEEAMRNEDEHACVCPEEREENSTMDNLFGNLGFGKLRDYRFKLSMNGIAVEQPNGKYVVYNKDNNEFVDVTNTLFDIKDALFLLPAVEVNAGDTVLHEGKAYFIVDTTNEIKAVSYEDCTQTVLIPKSTMFGIKYFQKVFSMFGDNFAATGDLFSNPMMLMALMDGKDSDLTQLMLLSSLNKGELGSNPMALAMLLKGDKGNDSLSTIALMSMFNNGTNPFAPKKTKVNKEN